MTRSINDLSSALSALLRSPATVAEACRDDRALVHLARASLLSIVFGGVVFGAVLGSFRGDLQILYSAIKLPLAVLVSLAVCVPAFHAFAAVLGRPWPLRQIIALVLASVARSSLVLLALAPVAWLGIDVGLSYHQTTLVAVAAYGIGGAFSLGVLLRGLGRGAGQLLTTFAFAAVFLGVGAQTAWGLRPYLGRPAQNEIPFVRDAEGGFADAIAKSARSSVGIYDRPRYVPEQDYVPEDATWQNTRDVSDVHDMRDIRDASGATF